MGEEAENKRDNTVEKKTYTKAKKSYSDSYKPDVSELTEITMQPIGVVHSPYKERFAAPRQPALDTTECATIELVSGQNMEQAVQDLDGFTHIWVIYWMHLNQGWNPTVLPPRGSKERRGVLSTRAPHRPNPLGLSLVELVEVKGRKLTIKGLDMLDGTPVLDIKPYLAYAESLPEAHHGWLQPLIDEQEA